MMMYMPVSYTHLDVYKRQRRGGGLAWPGPACRPCAPPALLLPFGRRPGAAAFGAGGPPSGG